MGPDYLGPIISIKYFSKSRLTFWLMSLVAHVSINGPLVFCLYRCQPKEGRDKYSKKKKSKINLLHTIKRMSIT